jgi:glutathione synthase/RimK-type ligase-like ATP-grasp enzyme
MSAESDIAAVLTRARDFATRGVDEDAKAAYLEILRIDPTHFAALNELGGLAYQSGHRTAALTCYRQAAHWHPGNPVTHVNLGNVLYENGDFATAQDEYEAALALSPNLAEAHQGLARVFNERGDDMAAASHRQKGFAGHAMVEKPYRGTGEPVPILLLVSAKGGNIPTAHWLDDRVFAVTALYAEFYDSTRPLPSSAVIFNAIGDADLCDEALRCSKQLVAQLAVPIINPPAQVRATGRVANAARLGRLPGVVAPETKAVTRSALLTARDLRFPLLLRAPGFHTGRHFLRVEGSKDLAAAVARLPGAELLVIQYLDARGTDGMTRKYRVMIIDGALYPLHLAIAADWKVHYFTADMAADPAYRAEEQRFLENMPEVLGPRALAALVAIGETLGLDYAGVDFGLSPDGSLLLFEANATMVINPLDSDSRWDYRRAPIGRALDAAKQMLVKRAGTGQTA